MPVEIAKEWAAVRGDEILCKRETRQAAEAAVRENGIVEPYEIVALPTRAGGVF